MRAGSALVAMLVLAQLTSASLASFAAEPEPAAKSDVRSIRGLASLLLSPRPPPSSSQPDAGAIREQLAQLRDAIREATDDPSPALLDRLGERKAAALRACKGLRTEIQADLTPLWRDVDYALADPVGQRARLDTARQRIDAALEQPSERRGPSVTILLELTSPERR